MSFCPHDFNNFHSLMHSDSASGLRQGTFFFRFPVKDSISHGIRLSVFCLCSSSSIFNVWSTMSVTTSENGCSRWAFAKLNVEFPALPLSTLVTRQESSAHSSSLYPISNRDPPFVLMTVVERPICTAGPRAPLRSNLDDPDEAQRTEPVACRPIIKCNGVSRNVLPRG